LLALRGSSFADAFREFAEWNLFTGSRADPARSYANGASYAELELQPAPLPFTADPLRVFYASAQPWTSDPEGRAWVEAALVGEPADIEGIELLLAVRRGSTIELASGTIADTAGADEVITVVIRPGLDGESQRPALCIGTPAEVGACREAVSAQPDAGTPEIDGGIAGADASVAPPPATGCTCRAGGERATPWCALALLVAVARRQDRRRHRGRRAA
jgi:hypothetical protein